jgi:hypothetical protein
LRLKELVPRSRDVVAGRKMGEDSGAQRANGRRYNGKHARETCPDIPEVTDLPCRRLAPLLTTKLPPSVTILSVITTGIPGHKDCSAPVLRFVGGKRQIYASIRQKKCSCRRDRRFEPAGMGGRWRASGLSTSRDQARGRFGAPAGRGICRHGDDQSRTHSLACPLSLS